jgi:hypothetical protein
LLYQKTPGNVLVFSISSFNLNNGLHSIASLKELDINLPVIIQGGLGVAISDWRLAKAVSQLRQLGVVSGTGLSRVLISRDRVQLKLGL